MASLTRTLAELVSDYAAKARGRMKTLTADTAREIEKILPADFELRTWEAQNSRDFVHALQEAIKDE